MIKIDPALRQVQNVAKDTNDPAQPTLFALPQPETIPAPQPINTSTAWVGPWVNLVLRANKYIPGCKSKTGYDAAIKLFQWTTFTPAQDAVMRQTIKQYLGLL